jgi:hypothetical protein
MCNYFINIKNSSEKYHEISNTLIFVKENISTIQQNQKEDFMEYSEIAKKFSDINKDNYLKIAKNIESEFEVNCFFFSYFFSYFFLIFFLFFFFFFSYFFSYFFLIFFRIY